MKLWIQKNSEVSVREQIVTQIKIGVASRDLLPGEKLPSTRELARRFGIHANTVSAAYRELAAENVVTEKRGSGVFIAEDGNRPEVSTDLDTLLAGFVSQAAGLGYARAELASAMERWLSREQTAKLLVVETDVGLRTIILEEIAVQTGIRAAAIPLEELRPNDLDESCVIAALFDEKDKLRGMLTPQHKAVYLEVNSVPHSLIGAGRPPEDASIAIVSCWQQFLAIARVYLLAAKIDPDTLIFRSTGEPGWERGLRSASLIICDSFTATKFPGDERLRVFKLLKEDSIEKLKHALL